MKYLQPILALLFFISTCAIADEPVCDISERTWVRDTRFFDTGVFDRYGSNPAHYLDLTTIKIDKKNKTIKAWIITDVSEKGRAEYIKATDNRFYNYGYAKALWIIDYGNMRIKKTQDHLMGCDGSVIMSFPEKYNIWQDVPPDTVGEGLTNVIMKKYNLK
jgi:hypothetical protein